MNKNKIYEAFGAIKKDIGRLNQKNLLIEKKIRNSFQAMKKDISASMPNEKTEELIDSLKVEVVELKDQVQKDKIEFANNLNNIPKKISDKLSEMDLLIGHVKNLKKEKSKVEKENKKFKREIKIIKNKHEELEHKLTSALEQQSKDFLKRENDIVESLREHCDKLFFNSKKKMEDDLKYYGERLREERVESRRKVDEIENDYEEKLEEAKKQGQSAPEDSLKKTKTQKKDLEDKEENDDLKNTFFEKGKLNEIEEEKQIIFGKEMSVKNLKINRKEGLFSKLVNKLSDD